MKIILAFIHTGRSGHFLESVDPRFYDEVTQTVGGSTLAELHDVGLQHAQSGAGRDDVILMLDNDETIAGDPEAFRAECEGLSYTPAGALYVERQDRAFAVVKVFAANATATFDACGHRDGGLGPLHSVRFTEAPATPERSLQDAEALSRMRPSWRRDHRLAEVYLFQGNKQAADYHFRRAIDLAHLAGEPCGAWSAYRFALTCLDGAPTQQAKALHAGFALDPTNPECLALLAVTANRRRAYEEALAYACQAIALGHVEGLRRPGNGFPSQPETFCKSWPERFDRPYLAAAIACEYLGRPQDARDYEQKAQVSRRLRLRHTLYLQTPPLGLGEYAGSPEAAQAIADTEPKPHWIEEP